MIEVDVRGRQAGVPEKALNLLQRIAKQPTVAIHPRSRRLKRRIAQAVLNQHREHVHGKCMPELVRADAHRKTRGLAALTRSRESGFPRVRLHDQADLCQPERAGLLGCAVVVANNKPAALVGDKRFNRDHAAVAERETYRAKRRLADEDRLPDRAPALSVLNLVTASVRSTVT